MKIKVYKENTKQMLTKRRQITTFVYDKGEYQVNSSEMHTEWRLILVMSTLRQEH